MKKRMNEFEDIVTLLQPPVLSEEDSSSQQGAFSQQQSLGVPEGLENLL